MNTLLIDASGQAEAGLSELKTQFSLAGTSITNMVLYIGWAMLAVGLIWVIYALANKSQDAKKILIAWFCAVAFLLLLGQLSN